MGRRAQGRDPRARADRTPHGLSLPLFAGGVLGLLAACLAVGTRRRLGILGAILVLPPLVFQAVAGFGWNYPARVMSPAATSAALGIALLLHTCTASLARGAQLALALVLVGVAGSTLPQVIGETRFQRLASHTVALAEHYARPDERSVFVCTGGLDPLRAGLVEAVGLQRFAESKGEARRRFRGSDTRADHEPSWKHRVRDWILPQDTHEPLNHEDIKCLVIVSGPGYRARATPEAWPMRELRLIRHRLKKRTSIELGPYRLTILE